MERGINVLAFGLPGTGKTHARCALGHRLVEAGHSVLFAGPVWYRNCSPPSAIWTCPASCASRTTSSFLLLDDLGYLPQGPRSGGPLPLIAERYERRSLGITSNLVFSEWERIFANPMATAAAIAGSCTTPSSWSLTSPATGPAAQQRGQAKEVNRQN